MTHEKSCGALVLRRGKDGNDYILMIRHRQGGNLSFPKGHMERGETEHMTACREVYEETGVRIRIRSAFRQTVHYIPSPGVRKEVVYFLCRTEQTSIRPRAGEIAEVLWIPLGKAESNLVHENDKVILRAAMEEMQKDSLTGTGAE